MSSIAAFPSSCCQDPPSPPPKGSAAPSSVCFSAPNIQSRCADPFEVLSASERCVDHCSSYAYICARPDPKERLIRLTSLNPTSDNTGPSTVVYQGSREGLWDSLVVGRLAPRWRIVPASVPHAIELVLGCVFLYDVFPFSDGGDLRHRSF
jgi:hypothetical protein